MSAVFFRRKVLYVCKVLIFSKFPICGLLRYKRPHIAFQKTAFYGAKDRMLENVVLPMVQP